MNICKKCGGNLILTTYSSTVCTQCGSEKQTSLTQEPIYQHSAPLDRSYSRPDRWKGLIRKLTGQHNGPNTRDPVWKYLKTNAPFKGPQEIIQRLRKSKLLNKHYQSTFIFSKIFSTHELPMNNEIVCKQLLSYFDFIYRLWNRYNMGKPFFSYNWLIEQYLREHKLFCFLKYIKHLQCPRRRQKYDNKMKLIYNEPETVKCQYAPRQMLQVSHFQNEISDVVIHRN